MNKVTRFIFGHCDSKFTRIRVSTDWKLNNNLIRIIGNILVSTLNILICCFYFIVISKT